VTAFSQRSATARFLIAAIVAAVLVAVVWLLWMAFGPGPMDFAGGQRVAGTSAQQATGAPAELASASLVERGQYLARAADCEACHTAEGGQPFAGGRAIVLPFGTLYSTNITADRQSGIGDYSDADFLRAMHQGIARDGTRLYPAMPYAAYTYMTDADALAIKAYLFSLAPVSTPRQPSTFGFPYNQRWLMSFWSLFFNPDVRFQPNSGRSPEWNRGAYLAEAMAHCGECHTPRNPLFALDNRRKFSGAVQAGWRAYNVTSDRNTGVGSWSADDLKSFLGAGHASGRGTAGGPMGEAVDLSLRYLTPGDVSALVAYLVTVPPVSTPDLPAVKATPAPASHSEGVTAAVDPRGKEVFEGACVGCHGWTGVSPVLDHATLTGVRSVNDPTAINVVQAVLGGATLRSDSHTSMPAFGDAYSDAEVAAVANYVTARFGSSPSSVTAANVADMRRQVGK